MAKTEKKTEKVKFKIDSLARRARPRTFADVVGQPRAVTALEGMLKRREIPNAIMFTGMGGTGKTTLAKMFAVMLNCDEGTGCGKCQSCLYPDEQHPDIKNMNAANHRGIDEIRKVIDGAKFKPRHNVRVIIMDEAHQLTPQAAESFLIPLETPPADTMYILCTTDPQKFTTTMLSRCTVIPLEIPSKKSIAVRLHQLAKQERVKVSKEVILAMAEASGGCVREAVNLLEVAANVLAGDPKIEEKELIRAVSTTPESDSNEIATKLLLGMYRGKTDSVVAAAFQITNMVQTLNAAIFMNQYAIGYDQQSPHIWHSPVNRDFRKLLESKVDEEKRSMKRKLLVHKKLITLRNELHNVPATELSMLLAHLT